MKLCYLNELEYIHNFICICVKPFVVLLYKLILSPVQLVWIRMVCQNKQNIPLTYLQFWIETENNLLEAISWLRINKNVEISAVEISKTASFLGPSINPSDCRSLKLLYLVSHPHSTFCTSVGSTISTLLCLNP